MSERVRRAPHVDVALDLPLAQTFTYRVPASMGALAPGTVVRVPFGRKSEIGVVVGEGDPAGLERVREIEELPRTPPVPPPSMELARRVAAYWACSWGEALHQCLPPDPGKQARRDPLAVGGDREAEAPLQATPEQEACIEAVRAPLEAGRFESFLLHGVTGSGKTEVYLRLIELCLRRGRGALLLLPEIALTPQTLRRLRRRFPGRVAPYHSRLSGGERNRVWEAAASGEAPVVVGARSAVFAPLRDLGLIVVDEEHEPSFKSDRRPRYHARDVALLRASIESVPVLLGSATPSLESYHHARTGKHRALALPARVGVVGELPRIRVVDRRSEGPAGFEPLGPELAAAIEAALGRGEQAIVFHNRRGFARFLQCPTCGDVVECPRCDISFTYHLRDDRLRCHYCDGSRRRPETCTACGERILDPRGTGTQRVELSLETRFPGARVLRMDQDTTGGRQSHATLLDRFRRGDADILVGTQMVAKGLHLPGVSVVGVVDADQGLHFPDFRAHERAFQLLVQVSGRSGRERPGEVIVQTRDPEHRVLARVRAHDVEGFLQEELEQRRELGYPPLRRLAAVTGTSTQEERLDRVLGLVAAEMRQGLPAPGNAVLGPARAALGRINRRYRGQILIKGPLPDPTKVWIQEVFERVRRGVPGGQGVDLVLDVDPLHLL